MMECRPWHSWMCVASDGSRGVAVPTRSLPERIQSPAQQGREGGDVHPDDLTHLMVAE